MYCKNAFPLQFVLRAYQVKMAEGKLKTLQQPSTLAILERPRSNLERNKSVNSNSRHQILIQWRRKSGRGVGGGTELV